MSLRGVFFCKILLRYQSVRLTGIVMGFGLVGVFLLLVVLSPGDVRLVARSDTVVLAVTPRLSEAIGLAREERTRIEAEKESFERFIQRIATIEPATQRSMPLVSSDSSVSQAVSTSDSSSDPKSASGCSLQKIREAYRQTVMDVPHYEEEYAESIEQHLSKEFGPELTRAVVQEGRLVPPVQKELLKQCRTASRERRILLQSVDRELDSLIDTRRTIREIHDEILTVERSLYPSTISEIVESWERLDTTEEEVKAILKQRQAAINTDRGGMSSHSLQEYLYQSQRWTYPALLDSLGMVRRVDEARDQVVQSLYSW